MIVTVIHSKRFTDKDKTITYSHIPSSFRNHFPLKKIKNRLFKKINKLQYILKIVYNKLINNSENQHSKLSINLSNPTQNWKYKADTNTSFSMPDNMTSSSNVNKVWDLEKNLPVKETRIKKSPKVSIIDGSCL